MTPQETAARFYDAWQNRRGDLSDVPLADDFQLTGPVASFDSAEGAQSHPRYSIPRRRMSVRRPATAHQTTWAVATAQAESPSRFS